MIFAVHGNIGCGKSTLLRAASAFENIIVVPEPIDKWCSTYADGKSMLEAFYEDKRGTALAFQMYVLLTQKRAYAEAIRAAPEKSIVLMERGAWESVDPMSQLMFDEGYMNSIEWAVYKDWRGELGDSASPSGIVYLRTLPDKCALRIQARNRPEEAVVDVEYLQRVHKVHERMLTEAEARHQVPVLILDGSRDPVKLAAEVIAWATCLQSQQSPSSPSSDCPL
jgi:deoxyadenosine/deoxycytidine kinase